LFRPISFRTKFYPRILDTFEPKNDTLEYIWQC
jgi:hypothetical protein